MGPACHSTHLVSNGADFDDSATEALAAEATNNDEGLHHDGSGSDWAALWLWRLQLPLRLSFPAAAWACGTVFFLFYIRSST